MISRTMCFVPYFIAVKISDYYCLIIIFLYMDTLVDIIFFNIGFTGPNSKQIKIVIYFHGKEIS